MTQHASQIIDHEDEAGHLVSKHLDPVYKGNRDRTGDTQSWYCEGCESEGRYSVAVQRHWDGIRWTVWHVA